MNSITVALVVATAISLYFTSTRRIGVLTIAALSFLFPVLALVLLLLGVVAAAFIHFSKGNSK